MTRSACSASRSVTLPFPSSPHWAPKTTIPGTTESVGTRARSAERGACGVPALAEIRAEQRQLICHLHQARDRAAADLLLERLCLDQVRRDDDRAFLLVALVDQGVELLEHPLGLPFRAEVVEMQEVDLDELGEEVGIGPLAARRIVGVADLREQPRDRIARDV